MKKKEICKLHKLLKKMFAERCKNLRCDDEIILKKGNKQSFKSVSIQLLANHFTSKIGSKYDASKISRLESEKAEITILDLYLYHKHYDVSYNYLMGCTRNKSEKFCFVYENYGLTDNTLKILNYLATTKEYEKELCALNEIFKSGLAQTFLNALYDYLHNDYENRLPAGYKPTNGELVEVELTTKAGKLNLGSDMLPLEKMNSLNKQILYDKLEQLKQVLNNKQNQNKNSNNILDNLYKNKA